MRWGVFADGRIEYERGWIELDTGCEHEAGLYEADGLTISSLIKVFLV